MGGALTAVADGIVEVDKEESKLEQSTAYLEILDEIQDIEDINSEKGKASIERRREKLRKLNGDEEDGSASAMKLAMPWEVQSKEEVSREIKKSVFALGYEQDLLCREADELDHQFVFDWKIYGY